MPIESAETKKLEIKKRGKPDKSSKGEGASTRTSSVTKRGDSESEEDQELLAAAAQWARKETEGVDQIQDKNTFSLHLTQLSFDTKEYDIRTLFEKNGCILTSVRKVYDRSGSEKTFRGVAFVDVADKKSFDMALALDRRVLLGRRINVRPTKTKEELADIVERTKELVAEKIRQGKERQDDAKVKGGSTNDDKAKEKRMPRGNGRKRDGDVAVGKKDKRPRKASSEVETKADADRKLTKQERNRRAAIIMNKRRK
jgi:RNA recognition motif-containing protein